MEEPQDQIRKSDSLYADQTLELLRADPFDTLLFYLVNEKASKSKYLFKDVEDVFEAIGNIKDKTNETNIVTAQIVATMIFNYRPYNVINFLTEGLLSSLYKIDPKYNEYFLYSKYVDNIRLDKYKFESVIDVFAKLKDNNYPNTLVFAILFKQIKYTYSYGHKVGQLPFNMTQLQKRKLLKYYNPDLYPRDIQLSIQNS